MNKYNPIMSNTKPPPGAEITAVDDIVGACRKLYLKVGDNEPIHIGDFTDLMAITVGWSLHGPNFGIDWDAVKKKHPELWE